MEKIKRYLQDNPTFDSSNNQTDNSSQPFIDLYYILGE